MGFLLEAQLAKLARAQKLSRNYYEQYQYFASKNAVPLPPSTNQISNNFNRVPEKQTTFNVGSALNFGNQQAQYGQLNNNNQQQNIFNSNQQQQAVGNYAVNNNNPFITNQNQNQVFNNNQQQVVGNYAINNNNPIRNNNQVLNNIPNNNIVFSNQNQNQVINNNNQQDQYGKPVSNPVGPNN